MKSMVHRIQTIAAPSDYSPDDPRLGHGLVRSVFEGKTLETARMVQRPTLLGALLARSGNAPTVAPPPRRGRPVGSVKKGGAA